MKRLKRIMALVIAMAMVLAMAVPTMAASTNVTITYDGNGNTSGSVPAAQTVAAGGSVTIADHGTLAKTDYGFTCWSDGTNKYYEGDVINVSSDMTLSAQWEQFLITVSNSRSDVSIKDHTFKAVKLFDASYAGDTTTGVDTTPHSYYLSTSSPFYETAYKDIIDDYFDLTTLAGDTTKVSVTPKAGFDELAAYEMAEKLSKVTGFDALAGYTGTGAAGTPEKAVINASAGGPGYYLVTGEGKSADGTDPVKATVALTTTDPKADIQAKLTGNTLEKKIDEGETEGAFDKNDPADAAKDDPAEDTHAVGDKVPYIVQTAVPNMTGYERYFFVVNDTLSKGLTYNDDLKIKITYTGDQYVEHLTSTMTAGTSGADDTYAVTNAGTHYKKADGSYVAKAEGDSALTTLQTTDADATPDDLANQYEVRNHQFVAYTDITTLGFVRDGNKYIKEQTIKIGDTDKDYTVTKTETAVAEANGKTTALEIIFKDFFNKVNGLTGAEVLLTYSATVNGDAVIGNEGNPNDAKLTFSNNPNVTPKGDGSNKDKPGSGDSDITGETPGSSTKTYVTGFELKKVNKDNQPLAGAKFELVGTNLNELVETSTEYFRPVQGTETGTHYLLTDGTYTTVDPTVDVIDQLDGTKVVKYTAGTYRKYVQDGWDSFTPGNYTLIDDNPVSLYTITENTTSPWKKGYIKDTVKSWKLDKKTQSAGAKLAVETDAEGLFTVTGLNVGWYKLTETEAPAGYNLLKSPMYLLVEWENDKSFKITKYEAEDLESETPDANGNYTVKSGKTGTAFSTDAANTAWLNDTTVENLSGVELPSTGGIGTTIFYVIGTILVLGAGVVLITRRRMDA